MSVNGQEICQKGKMFSICSGQTNVILIYCLQDDTHLTNEIETCGDLNAFFHHLVRIQEVLPYCSIIILSL